MVSSIGGRRGPGTDEEAALLAALVELHRKKHRKRSASSDGPYAQVLEHFEQRGKRLRGERLVTEDLIARTLESTRALPAPSAQQELEIVGRVGTSAAGRFRVENRAPRTVRVEFAVGEALSGAAPGLRFDPPSLELATGASALVRVEADLSAWRKARSSTVPVECRAEGRRDRLWLTITAFAAGEVSR